MVGANRALRGEVLVDASAEDRRHFLLRDLGIARSPCVLVLGLDEQPWIGLVAALPAHTNEVPTPLEARAVEREIEVAFGESAVRIGFGRPRPAVPHDHGAAAIFALGYDAFPFEVVHRMVVGLDGEALLAGHETRTACHGPALEHPVELEAQVEMKPAGIV